MMGQGRDRGKVEMTETTINPLQRCVEASRVLAGWIASSIKVAMNVCVCVPLL